MLNYHSLCSGSSGNCSVVSSGETHILIDGGISARRIGLGLQSVGLLIEDLSAVLVTHGHSDHICGLPVLMRKYGPKLFCTRSVRDSLRLDGIEAQVFLPGDGFFVGEMKVQSFATPHDAEESCGFVIESQSQRFGYATDLGYMPEEVCAQLSRCSAVVLESNYDADMLRLSSYPPYIKRRVGGKNGHLCNEDCARTLVRLLSSGCRRFALAHLSHENNKPEIAREASVLALQHIGAREGTDFSLFTLPRYERSLMLQTGG